MSIEVDEVDENGQLCIATREAGGSAMRLIVKTSSIEEWRSLMLQLYVLAVFSALLVKYCTYFSSLQMTVVLVAVLVLVLARWILKIVREEVLLEVDYNARPLCVHVQCASFDAGGRMHRLQSGDIVCDGLLPLQAMINECFICMKPKDVLGFLVAQGEDRTKPKKFVFLMAFEHIIPRLSSMEHLYNSVFMWLSDVHRALC